MSRTIWRREGTAAHYIGVSTMGLIRTSKKLIEKKNYASLQWPHLIPVFLKGCHIVGSFGVSEYSCGDYLSCAAMRC
jgi:hypothetical protein